MINCLNLPYLLNCYNSTKPREKCFFQLTLPFNFYSYLTPHLIVFTLMSPDHSHPGPALCACAALLLLSSLHSSPLAAQTKGASGSLSDWLATLLRRELRHNRWMSRALLLLLLLRLPPVQRCTRPCDCLPRPEREEFTVNRQFSGRRQQRRTGDPAAPSWVSRNQIPKSRQEGGSTLGVAKLDVCLCVFRLMWRTYWMQRDCLSSLYGKTWCLHSLDQTSPRLWGA